MIPLSIPDGWTVCSGPEDVSSANAAGYYSPSVEAHTHRSDNYEDPLNHSTRPNRVLRRHILRTTGGFAGRCKGCGRRLG